VLGNLNSLILEGRFRPSRSDFREDSDNATSAVWIFSGAAAEISADSVACSECLMNDKSPSNTFTGVYGEALADSDSANVDGERETALCSRRPSAFLISDKLSWIKLKFFSLYSFSLGAELDGLSVTDWYGMGDGRSLLLSVGFSDDLQGRLAIWQFEHGTVLLQRI
jgi:hypothetical protein